MIELGGIRQPRGYSVNHTSAQLPRPCSLERKYHGLYYQMLNLSQDTFLKLCKYPFNFPSRLLMDAQGMYFRKMLFSRHLKLS